MYCPQQNVLANRRLAFRTFFNSSPVVMGQTEVGLIFYDSYCKRSE
jgi:hypothetical protein